MCGKSMTKIIDSEYTDFQSPFGWNQTYCNNNAKFLFSFNSKPNNSYYMRALRSVGLNKSTGARRYEGAALDFVLLND